MELADQTVMRSQMASSFCSERVCSTFPKWRKQSLALDSVLLTFFFSLQNHWLRFLLLPGLVQLKSQMLSAFFLASPSSSAGGAGSPGSSPSAGLGFSGCGGGTRWRSSSWASMASGVQTLRQRMVPMCFSIQQKSSQMSWSWFCAQLQRMTSRYCPFRTSSATSFRDCRRRLKYPRFCRIAMFWYSRLPLSCTRNTRGFRISSSSFSAWISGCEKSTWYSTARGHRAPSWSAQSAFLAMASLILAASSSLTSAARSASFFLRVLRVSSLSSVLRLMTRGGPLALTQLSMSFQSTLSPSMRRGALPLLATSVAKWAMTLRKGSSSPSSGAMSFSLMEATQGSYSMWRQPSSELMNLAALVLPTQGGPASTRYLTGEEICFSKGKSRWMYFLRCVSRKQMVELNCLLSSYFSGLRQSAKSLKGRVRFSSSMNSSGFQGQSVKQTSGRVKLRKTVCTSSSSFSESAFSLVGLRRHTVWISKMFSSSASACSMNFRTPSRSSPSCTFTYTSSGLSFSPTRSSSSSSRQLPSTLWKQPRFCSCGTSCASWSKNSSCWVSSVRRCRRCRIFRWQCAYRMLTSSGRGVNPSSTQLRCLGNWARKWFAVTGSQRRWQPVNLRQLSASTLFCCLLGPQTTMTRGYSSLRRARQLGSLRLTHRPMLSQSFLMAFSSAEKSPCRKMTVSSSFQVSTLRKSSAEPYTMRPFLSCSLRVVSEGATRCRRECSRAYWAAREPFCLGPKMKYHTTQSFASYISRIKLQVQKRIHIIYHPQHAPPIPCPPVATTFQSMEAAPTYLWKLPTSSHFHFYRQTCSNPG